MMGEEEQAQSVFIVKEFGSRSVSDVLIQSTNQKVRRLGSRFSNVQTYD